MPSSPTITSTDLTTFVAGTTIKSGEMNSNFSVWRGHNLPVHPSTSTVATTTSYDLGSTSAAWRNAYVQTHSVVEQSTVTTSPQSGYLNVYAKTDGRLYKRTSAGAESEIAVYKAPTIQKFTSGSGTYTTPTGCRWLAITMVGGGGGGGGGGAGAGGGGTGGTTSFGSSLLTCAGGAGGAGNSGAPGTGGAPTLNSPAIGTALTGGAAQGSISLQSGTGLTYYNCGGMGAASALGGSGKGGDPNAAGGAGAANTGAGGGGGGTGLLANQAGGAGGGSGAYISAIIFDPSSTYSYVVGAGATAGAAGTTGFAGAAGGSGYIEVREHY